MPKKIKSPHTEPTADEELDLSEELAKLDLDQQIDAIAEGIDIFCDRMLGEGVDPEIINTVLLTVYCERMNALGDRELFEQQMEEALDVPWDTYSLH